MAEIFSDVKDVVASKIEARRQRNARRAHLPVLLVPGFMSSGLMIEKSGIKESWEGKRIWLNTAVLGLQKLYKDPHSKAEGDRSSRRRGRRSLLERMDGTRFSLLSLDASDDDSDDDDSDCGDSADNPDEDGDERERLLRGDGAGDGSDKCEHAVTRNLWIKHISLSPGDLKSDPCDVRVRPVGGVEGIAYLTTDAISGPLSHVWAPVVKALEKHGYREGINLEAAPYDWRLSPRHLEERDGYFTAVMRKVEELRERTGLPVVVVGHSLGTKVAEYLLAFAHAKDGTWCDRHVHAYMPVGGVHLGAPFTLRALVTSYQMGLEVFFNASEGLAMARTLGSIPWMLPTHIPPFTPENAFVRREGAFEIHVDDTVDVAPFFERRLDGEKPTKLKLKLRYGSETVRSKFFPVVDGKVHFKGDFVFSTGPEGPYERQRFSWCCRCCILRCACSACCSNNQLIVSIYEPGYRLARKTKDGVELRRKCCSFSTRLKWLKILFCWWIIKWLLILVGFLLYLVSFGIWLSFADAINKFCGGSSQLAVSEPIELCKLVDEAESHDVEIELRDDMTRLECCRKGGGMPSIKIIVNWVPPRAPENASAGCQLSELGINRYKLIDGLARRQNKRDWDYKAMSGSGMLKLDLGRDAPILKAVSEIYDADPLLPRSLGPPPVKNVKAVYGINRPTEVGAVYKRKSSLALRRHKVKSKYELDEDVKFKSKNGYVLEDGVLYETKDSLQIIEEEGRSPKCSGDGTVPYWSLQHVRSWSHRCNVEVSELDGAEHKAILNDRRFHDILVDYVTSGADDRV